MARKATSETSTGTVKLKAVTGDASARPKAAGTAAPTPRVVGAATPVVAGRQVKKPDFLDRAMTRTEVKRRDAKPAIEAALAELAEILLAGDEVNLPPLGKIKVVKARELGDGAQVLTLKLRTMKDGAGSD